MKIAKTLTAVALKLAEDVDVGLAVFDEIERLLKALCADSQQ